MSLDADEVKFSLRVDADKKDLHHWEVAAIGEHLRSLDKLQIRAAKQFVHKMGIRDHEKAETINATDEDTIHNHLKKMFPEDPVAVAAVKLYERGEILTKQLNRR